jgi:hypothetical protein
MACSASAQTITYTGTGFQSGATVSDGADTFGPVTVSSATSANNPLNVLRNIGVGGARTLVFTNPDGGSVSKSFTPTNCANPTVTVITPNTGTITGPTLITLTGTNFLNGLDVNVNRAGIDVDGVSGIVVVSSTKITFTWDPPTRTTNTAYTFVVTQDGDTASRTSGNFKVN